MTNGPLVSNFLSWSGRRDFLKKIVRLFLYDSVIFGQWPRLKERTRLVMIPSELPRPTPTSSFVAPGTRYSDVEGSINRVLVYDDDE